MRRDGFGLSLYTYRVAIDMLAKHLLPMDQIITHAWPLSAFQHRFGRVACAKQSIRAIGKP
jgi:hypothetical protein